MAFQSLNFTPIGGNSRSGIETERNAPMGWAYASQTDTVADVTVPNSYFDSINKIVAKDQFIYAALADDNVIFTISSVDRKLQQVTLATEFLQPVAPGPDNVTNVFSEADFGTESGGIIELDGLEHFILFRLTVVANTLQTTVAPSFNEISSTFFPETRIECNAKPAITLLKGLNVFFYALTDLAIFDTSNGFAVKGVNTLFDFNRTFTTRSFVLMQNATFRDFASLGTIKNIDGFSWIDGSCFNCGPLLIQNIETITITGTDLTTDADLGETFITIESDDVNTFMEFSGGVHAIRNGESVIMVDPYIGEGSIVQILNTRINNEGTGTFFKQGITGTITAWADNSSTGSITGVVDNLNGTATVTTSVAHDLETFQKVVLSAMTISAYDGSFKIQSTPTTTTFIIILDASAGTATGTWTTDSVTATTTNTLSNGQTLLIAGTVAYNSGAKIYGASGIEFSIDRVFVTPETVGTWNTGSLTGTDKRVRVFNVQGEPDSNTFFSLSIIDGTAVSDALAMSAWNNINMTPSQTDLNGTELFTLINSATGEFRYDGARDVTINFSGFVTGLKVSGGLQTYQFLPEVNGTLLLAVLPKATMTPTSTASDTATLGGAIVLSPGDTIKLQFRNLDSAIDLTIQQMSFTGS